MTMTPESIREAAEVFRGRYKPGRVRGLLVAGSGLELEVPGWTADELVELAEIFTFSMHELVGHRQTLTLWRRGDESLMVMNGRFHLYQGYRPEEVSIPWSDVHKLGVDERKLVDAEELNPITRILGTPLLGSLYSAATESKDPHVDIATRHGVVHRIRLQFWKESADEIVQALEAERRRYAS